MRPTDRTTRSDVIALPSEVEALVVAPGRAEGRALAAFLKTEDIRVRICQDSDSAYEDAVLHSPGLALIHDATGPSGGLELCQRLKSGLRTHFVPVIVFDSVATNDSRVALYGAGADAVFDRTTSDRERQARLWALLRSSAMYQRLERRQRRQGDALADRRRWVGSFVHDVQNSLGALQANFEFLAHAAVRSGLATDPEVADSVRDTRVVFNQVTRGLRTVLEYERFETGRAGLKETFFSLRRLLEDIEKDARAQLGEGSSARLSFRLPGPDLESDGDPEALRLGLGQLVLGLLRLGGKGNVVVGPADAVHAHAGADLQITLDKVVLSSDELERLFEPYGRTPKSGPLGQGIGFALARLVLEMHGGTIDVHPDASGGLTFLVTLVGAGVEARAASPTLSAR